MIKILEMIICFIIRTYVKDKSATGPQCLYEEQKKNITYSVMNPLCQFRDN